MTGKTAESGWSEGVSKEGLEEWSDKADEVLGGWDKRFFEREREVERDGWMKVSRLHFHATVIALDPENARSGERFWEHTHRMSIRKVCGRG